MSKYNKDWLKPNWVKRKEEAIKEYQKNEDKLKNSPDSKRDIDMGGGCRTEEGESSWYDEDFK